jgi:hypothetical protein
MKWTTMDFLAALFSTFAIAGLRADDKPPGRRSTSR